MADINYTISVETLIGEGPTRVLALAKAIADLGAEMAQLGDKMSDARAASKLTTAQLRELEEATDNEVTQLELMQAAALANLRGIRATTSGLAAMAKMAKLTADATGGDFRSAMEKMIRAVSAGGTSLKRLGIEVSGNADQTEILAAIVKAAGERTEEFGNKSATAGDALSRLSKTTDDWIGQMSEAFTTSAALNDGIREMEDSFAGANLGAAQFGSTLGRVAGDTVSGFARIIEGVQSVVREIQIAHEEANVFIESLNPFRGDGKSLRQIRLENLKASRNDAMRQQLALLSAQGDEEVLGRLAELPEAELFGEVDPEVARRRAALAAARPKRTGGAGGRQRSASAPEEITFSEAEVSPDPFAFLDLEEQRRLNHGVRMAELDSEDLERERSYRDSLASLRQEDAERERQLIEQIAANREAEVERQIQIDEARLRAAAQTVTAVGGLAMQGAELLGLGEREKLILLGIAEAAQAAANFAIPGGQIAGIAHSLASAIAFKGAAQVASRIRRGSGSVGSGTFASSGTAPGSDRSFGGGGRDGGGGNTTIVVNVPGSLSGKREIEDAIVEGVRRAGRRGNTIPRDVVR